MYHPSRGGVRGGRDQFNWDDVKVDKHRENYLGHSIRAPVGRWQKGKDLHWYARDKKSAEAIAKDEIKRIQEEEDEAMQEMLGLAPKKVVPRHNQLDDREVSELLKKGQDGETSAPSYAAGERVEGLGFAPAPPQTVHGQVALENVKSSKAVGVVYEKDSSALPIEESRQKLAGNAEEQAPGEDDERILAGQTAVRVGDEDGSHTSTSESEGVSRKERKEERRRARLKKKERTREEKRARKQARFDGKIKSKHKKAGPDRQSWYDKEEIEREATDGKVRSEWKTSKGVSGTTKDSEIENASRSYGKAHSSHHGDGTETMGRRKLSTQDIGKYVGRELHHKKSITGLSRHDSSEASEEREEPDRDQSSEERHERSRQVIRYHSAGEGGDKRISARHNGNERSRDGEARWRHDSSEEREGNRRLGRYRRDEVGRKRGRVRHDSSEESDDRRRIAKYDSKEETRAKRGQARHEGSWESDDSGRLAKHDSRKESRVRSGQLRHDSGKETGDSGRLVKYDSREESRAKTGRLRHDGGEESADGERLVKYDSREGSRANKRRVRHDSIVESDDSRERTGHNGARMREAPQYKGNYEGRVQGLHGGDNENTRSNKQRQDRRRGGDGKQETKRSPP